MQPGSEPVCPGVPLAWREGVMLMNLPAPPTILPRRWAELAITATRLLQDRGAELHAAGWDTLALFGLDTTAPATNPFGWGLAWLLGEQGEVVEVTLDRVTLRREPTGAQVAYPRPGASARASMTPAWLL